MSYICLFASAGGAAAAGDSRITIHTIFPGLTLHHDRGCKVFHSDRHQDLWAATGITRRFFFVYPRMTRRIMKNDRLPLEKRLEQIRRLMLRSTRPLPFGKKGDVIFNLIYASYPAEGDPMIGSLGFKNGKLIQDKQYLPPVVLENGMNMHELTSIRNYPFRNSSSPEKLKNLAEARVRESIEKDRELKSMNPRYTATIGGHVKGAVVFRKHSSFNH